MRISDWSSDVCSSDLLRPPPVDGDRGGGDERGGARGVRKLDRAGADGARTARGRPAHDGGCRGGATATRRGAAGGADRRGWFVGGRGSPLQAPWRGRGGKRARNAAPDPAGGKRGPHGERKA